MEIVKSKVQEVKQLKTHIYLLKAFSPEIARTIKPGQFCNIKTSENSYPLLRRPFSISDVDGDYIYFMFDQRGEGTRLLSLKKPGDELDILGPLGKGFNFDAEFETAVLAAGGLGTAPFPFVTRILKDSKKILSYAGARSSADLITEGMINVKKATDDGSEGFHGNVVQLLENSLDDFINSKPVIFACGPTPMLKNLQNFAKRFNVKTFLSTECAMACGFGICQGCPVDTPEDKYKLVCKDGPVFDSEEIIL